MTQALTAYMEKLDNLPSFMTKNLTEIGELDQKSDSLLKEIKAKTVAMLKMKAKMTKDQKHQAYKDIQAMYKEVDKVAEKKIKIAAKLYDHVDEHITEMDKEIATFNDYQIKKYEEQENRLTNHDVPEKKRKNTGVAQKGDKKKKKTAVDNKIARHAESSSFMDEFKPAPMAPNVDMPIDPNEPIYCICHQVSFGQMVACDNKDCKTEWFHFQCVGLTANPSGAWYCEECKELRKKKK